MADEYVWEEVVWVLATGWLCCTTSDIFALSSFDDVGPRQHPSLSLSYPSHVSTKHIWMNMRLPQGPGVLQPVECE